MVAEGRPGELAAERHVLHSARLRLPTPPTAEERARFSLEPERAVRGDAGGVWRLRSDLDRASARALLRLALEKDWELLEWGAGAAGLESLFRRLTLGDAADEAEAAGPATPDAAGGGRPPEKEVP